MTNVMLDLETLGTKPGCSILSIGAVVFDESTGTVSNPFHLVISRESCQLAGLIEDPATLLWWSKQSSDAAATLHLASSAQVIDTQAPLYCADAPVTLAVALRSFASYLGQFGTSAVKVWGNGSDFDQPILAAAFAAIESDLPWRYTNNRCYRTLKSLRPDIKLAQSGTLHNALDDATTQASHAIQLLRAMVSWGTLRHLI